MNRPRAARAFANGITSLELANRFPPDADLDVARRLGHRRTPSSTHQPTEEHQMKIIEHSVDIAAPPEAVWDVLTDVDTYSQWNPFLTFDRAPVVVGERVRITVRPGRRTVTFRPTVTAYEPGREIAWLGRFLAPGIVDGAHTLAIEPLPDGGRRFRQREVFRGALVPFKSTMLRDTSAGFAAMNTALATRAETRPVINRI